MKIFSKGFLILLFIYFLQGIIIITFEHFILINSHHYSLNKNYRKNAVNIIEKEIKKFPIPTAFQDEIYYNDSYGEPRTNGKHEGCDILDVKNTDGRIPIISATDGIIMNLGWLYLGGYRIGILSENNIYYYYAHFDSYNPSLKVGDKVLAGQLLGFMGSTGEGEEGSKGKFPVHLHFGIYFYDHEKVEKTVNSYPFLRKIDMH